MKKSLLLLPLTMAFLCGCKESSTIQTYQPSINVETSIQNEEATVKKTNQKATKNTKNNTNKNTKTTTTTTTAPKTNNSTIKDLIIDGNGNLVATKSNNSFAIIGNIQGAKGDKGEKGDKGDSGSNGRGIASCNVDPSGDLIITYTDGTTQNAGNVRQEVVVHDYEQVGYELFDSSNYPMSASANLHSFHSGYTVFGNIVINIANSNIKLISVNQNNPSLKYKYQFTINYNIDKCELDSTYWNSPNLHVRFYFDSTKTNFYDITCPYNSTSAIAYLESSVPFSSYKCSVDPFEDKIYEFDRTTNNETIFYYYK